MLIKLLVFITDAVTVDLYNAYVFVWFIVTCVVSLVCMRVACVVLHCTPIPIFTCASIAHICDGHGFDSTSPTWLRVVVSATSSDTVTGKS